jgi:hypothetical protein
MWNKKVRPDRQATDDNTIERLRIAYWLPNGTDTYSEYVIIIACPFQQWLHERAPILRHTYIACSIFNSWQLTHTTYVACQCFSCNLKNSYARGNSLWRR